MTAIILFFSMTILLGIIYPTFVWVIGTLFFNEQTNGSLIVKDGKIIGSKLIAQPFVGEQYFHPRPSICDYNPTASGGSNLAPSNITLAKRVNQYIDEMKKENAAPIPSDMVMSSASGLDPDISVESALCQVPRIAKVREIDEKTLIDIINQHIEWPFLGFIGEPRVNVLLLNIYLDNNYNWRMK